MKKFPKFPSHDKATCCRCGEALTDAEKSNYPIGRWTGFCLKCGMHTWYDLDGSTDDVARHDVPPRR